MANYKYRAMNPDNQKIEGRYEARSKEQVVDFITGNGLYPLMVEEIVESTNIEIKINRKVKIKDIAVFCRQFYTMLNAGVPILECLTILRGQVENIKLRNAVADVEEEVKRGGVLSDAMKKHDKIFPKLFISLVESGEASGRLEEIMLRMSNYYEKENKINNKVKNAMIYPIILSLVCIVAVVFILTYVMPTFVDIFKQTGTSLPWNTRLLLWTSQTIIDHWFILLVGIVVIVFGVKSYLKTEQGKITYSKLKLSIPVIKTLNQKIIVSQFTRTLSTLISSGLPLIECLNIVTKVVSNKIAEDALGNVTEKVSRGEGLHSSLKETEIFPNMLYSMVRIGEETGSLDDILNKTADFYDDELEAQIQAAVSLMEPVLIVIMGLIIAFIVISVMLPLFDSYSKI